MTESEARLVQKYARLQGIAVEAGPADTAHPEGPWRLYGRVAETRTDVTARVLRTLKTGPAGPRHPVTPFRGFVI
ncbi:hypothetical protein [Streptomyces sp. NPDC003077]|uniref:hypothetical protein n=1 Tax=Streptomyces sp. NPDC003077 TaxID=3154443 RepID=UPI0033BE53D1